MPSMEIFTDSYKEIKKIQKGLGGDQVTLRFNKLDPTTREMLRQTILSMLKQRLPEVSANATGSTSDWML